MQRAIIQMAYVTRTLDASVDYWVKVIGAGPFFYSDVYFPAEQIYRGKPAKIKFRLACAFSGDMHIEIVQQEDEAPSPFMEVLEGNKPIPAGGMFHHVQLALDGFDAVYNDLLNAGAERCFDALVPGLGRLSFIDARAQMGCFAELVEPNIFLPKLRAKMRELHRNWDGKNPKRGFDDLARLVQQENG